MATFAPTLPSLHPHRALNAVLWIAQALLAAMFVFAGGMKAFSPADQLVAHGLTIPVALARFIGICELLGAIGVILPSLTRIAPRVTALAAAALCLVMILATGYEIRVHDPKVVPMTIGLGALAAFVAWGRWRGAPIADRSLS